MRVKRPTCQAADEPLLSVLVEQVRAEDQLQTLVTRLTGARCQHLVQQRHLLVSNAAHTRQRVFDQTQDLPEDRRTRAVNRCHGANIANLSTGTRNNNPGNARSYLLATSCSGLGVPLLAPAASCGCIDRHLSL